MLSPLILAISRAKTLILCLCSVGMSHSGSAVSVNSKCLNPIVRDFCPPCPNAFLHWYSITALFMSQQLCVLCFKWNQYRVLFCPLTWDITHYYCQTLDWNHDQCVGPDVDSCFASPAVTKMDPPPAAHLMFEIQHCGCWLLRNIVFKQKKNLTMLDHFHILLYSSVSDHVHILLYGGFFFFFCY